MSSIEERTVVSPVAGIHHLLCFILTASVHRGYYVAFSYAVIQAVQILIHALPRDHKY